MRMQREARLLGFFRNPVGTGELVLSELHSWMTLLHLNIYLLHLRLWQKVVFNWESV